MMGLMTTPKHRAKSPPYHRLNSEDVKAWRPGALVVKVSEVVYDLPEPKRCDMSKVIESTQRVDNQVFDMMGGIQY